VLLLNFLVEAGSHKIALVSDLSREDNEAKNVEIKRGGKEGG
jgi:hypothetical protein